MFKERGDDLSVKIKVSFTNEKELQGILNLLQPITKKFKISENQAGEHKNAYIEVKQG